MSDNTIDQPLVFLKDLDEKIKKLSKIIDQLDVLAFNFKKLSLTIDQIDMLIFRLRMEYDALSELVTNKKF